MDDDTFRKRVGTTNLGIDFEDAVTANLVLDLISTKRTFKISSNAEKFGAFDDIVLETPSKLYAIQLKHHKNKNPPLFPKEFMLKGKDFYLQKYFTSFKSIEKPTSYQLIFYTNLIFQDELFVEPFQYKNFMISVRRTDKHEIFNTEFCYSFEITASEEPNQEFETFLKNLVLLSNQPHVEETKQIFFSKFQEQFCSSLDEAERFFNFVKSWSICEKKKTKLCQKYMQQVITLLTLRKSIKPLSFGAKVSEKKQLLRKAIGNFDVTLLQEEGGVHTLWSDENLEEIPPETVSKVVNMFRLSSLDDLERTKLLWLIGKCPLIIFDSPTSAKIVQMWPYRKFVLITRETHDDLECRKFRTLSDLEDDGIENTFTFSMQERKEKNLKSFKKYGLKTMVTTNELLKMTNGPYTIGKKEKICQPYIPRWLSQNYINIGYLNVSDKDTLIVLDCKQKLDKIKNKIGNFNLYDIEIWLRDLKQSKCDLERPIYHTSPCLQHYVSGHDMYISDNVYKIDEFLSLQKESTTNFHHLKIVDENNLQWIRSKEDIQDLKKHLVKSYVEENSFYCRNPDNSINVIVADSGMGKSKLLRNIKNNTKLWTVLITSNDMTSLCSEKLTEATFMDYVITTVYADLPEFDKNFIKKLMENHQVAYFWDALDEINTVNLEKITDFIKELFLEELCCFQWLTARTHLKNYLEKKFHVLARTIRQFSRKEQISYINTRLRGRNTDEEIQEITLHIQPLVTLFKHSDVLGAPLQICMLTELFRQDHKKYRDLLKEDCIVFLANLFQHIIDEKFNRFYEEKANVCGANDVLKKVLEVHKRSRLKKYRKAALKALISEEFHPQLDVECEQFLDDLKNEAYGVGIITEVVNSLPQFLHKSYAEFLAAEYFTKHKNDFKKISSDGNYVNIQFFYDILTAKNSSAHIGVLYKNVDFLKKHKAVLNKFRDGDGRTTLELACFHGLKHPRLQVEEQNGTYIINTDSDDLPTGESQDYKEMFNYLLENCTNCDTDFDKLLTSADKSGCLWTKLQLLLQFEKKITNDDGAINLLYFSTKFGYHEVFKLFAQVPFVKTNHGFSLLHLAVIYGHNQCLKSLLSLEVYRSSINEKDNNGETALFNACQTGSLFAAEVLMDSSADINATTTDGTTPLHTACLHHQLNIVELLLQNDDSIINTVKDFGVTPLHLAAWNGHLEIVEFLLRYAEIDVAADDGCTPLYVASRNNNDAVVHVLISAGAGVDLAQEDGATPLFVASQEGHVRNVEILLKAGADVNMSTKTGETPLFIARQNKHEEVARILIEKGGVEFLH